jgi:hypothetical protein
VRSEQRSRRDAKILFAALAPKPQRAIRTAGFIGIKAAAERANWRAVGIGPAQGLERGFGFPVSHAEDLSQAQGLCRASEEEVL